jgi:serine/threonine-protein phosphatase 2B regulatory subunit
MGVVSSLFGKKDDLEVYLSQEELEEVKIGSCFTRQEIQRLYNRFKKVDADGSNTLDRAEFLNFPEFRLNPLAYRLVDLLDTQETGEITFRDFVRVMSAFSPSAPDKDKYHLAYQLYDADNDGLISKADLTATLRLTTYVSDKARENELGEADLNVPPSPPGCPHPHHLARSARAHAGSRGRRWSSGRSTRWCPAGSISIRRPSRR